MQKIHECDWCGKREPWGPTWQWWGTGDECVFKACSEECMKQIAPQKRGIRKKRTGVSGFWLDPEEVEHARCQVEKDRLATR